MAATVFGNEAHVTMMNLALHGGDFVLSTAAFDTQVGAAQDNLKAYANSIGASVGGTLQEYVDRVLDNMGINNAALNEGLYWYIEKAGFENRGVVTLQLGMILSSLESDPTYGAAAVAWNNSVSENFEEWSGSPPASELVLLTAGLDNVQLIEGQNALANAATFNPGDHVHGASGDFTVLLGMFTGTLTSTVLDTLDNVNIQFDAGSNGTLVASQWVSIDNVNVKNSKGTMVLSDLQATSNDSNSGTFSNYLIDDFKTAGTLELNFDSQAADGAATVVNLGVKEVTGNVKLTGETAGANIETLNMTINDSLLKTSDMASLRVQGLTTLNINGGTAGLNFSIVEALDAGITKIDASTAASNLTLSVTASTKAMNIALGTGDDTLVTGDTLSPIAPAADTINGGDGKDHITAIFTTAGTRQPTMTKVETATLTFNANATLNLGDTNDLATINVLTSTNRIALEDMDSTVRTINVTGNQAGQTVHEFIYEDQYLGQVGTTSLTLNWTQDKANDNFAGTNNGAGEIEFGALETLVFNHSGRFDTFFSDLVGDGNDAIFQFDDTIRSLTINNNGTGDMYMLGGSNNEAIAGTRRMETVSLNAIGGDLAISGDIDSIRDLINLTLTADRGNYLALDDIGSLNDFGDKDDFANGNEGYGRELEYVTIATGSNSGVFFDNLNAQYSTVSTFNVTLANDSVLVIDGNIRAQDVSDATFEIAEEAAFVHNDQWQLLNQGNNLKVFGGGEAINWVFDDETFANMDFSGLMGNGVNGIYLNFDDAVKGGSNVIATGLSDWIESGEGNDTVDGGAGNDIIKDEAGNDILMGGAGNDYIHGGDGSDTVTGGSGGDVFLVGYVGAKQLDVITDFGVDADRMEIALERIEQTIGDQVVNGIGFDVLAGDAVKLQTFAANGQNSNVANFQTNIFNVAGTFATVALLEQAIQTGGNNEIQTLWPFGFGLGDGIIVTWSDGTNMHLSIAQVTGQFFANGPDILDPNAYVDYDFDVKDIAVLQGVTAITEADFTGFVPWTSF